MSPVNHGLKIKQDMDLLPKVKLTLRPTNSIMICKTWEVIYFILLSPGEVRVVMLFLVLDATLKRTDKQTGYSSENSKDNVMFKKHDL